ncbi:MAG: hypothetical protein ACKVIQ_00695 [Acidimicrobiales bacterium]
MTVRAGDEIGEPANDEVDVLVVTKSGAGKTAIDGERANVGSALVMLIPQVRCRRSVLRSAWSTTAFINVERILRYGANPSLSLWFGQWGRQRLVG